MALNLQHQTPAEFVDRLRQRWHDSEKEEKARIGAWLYARYNAGDITATQIRTAFGLTALQLSAFAARLQALSDARALIQAEQMKKRTSVLGEYMRKVTAIVLCLLLILAMPVHADELQDRIESAITAFGGLIPHAPDVGLGWADMVIDNAVKQANPNAAVSSDNIGVWITSNQPKDIDPILMQRAEWLASTFKQVMLANTQYDTALPAQSISVAELKLRIDTAIDKVTPGPTKEEVVAQSIKAGELYAEYLKEKEAKIRR